MGAVGEITEFRLFPPRIDGQVAHFAWAVEPASDLYRQTHFQLEFPQDIDLRAVPPALWLFVGIMCLHTQWLLLRPCRIVLPADLTAGEVECWRRLLDVETRSLQALRGEYAPAPGVELVTDGPGLPTAAPLADSGRWATAFSSGKDSLVQAALLREPRGAAVLVAVSSELPGINDNSNRRKKRNSPRWPRSPVFA